MEALLSEAEALPGLVAVAGSGQVRDWDAATLRRALAWARFAQHLHGRRRGLRAAGGERGRGPERLSLALLGNPALPPPAYRSLLRGLLLPEAGEGEGAGDCGGLLPLLARRKAAARLLGLPPPPPPPAGPPPPPLRAQAQLLLSRLREEEERDEEGGDPPPSPAALLERLPGGPPALSRVLAAALLEPQAPSAARLLLPWLLRLQRGSPGRLSAFCRLLPARWLAWLCGRYPQLRAPYWGLLAAWGSRLGYDPRLGHWQVREEEEEAQRVPWPELRERVACLLEEPEPLRGETRTQLRRLRAQDGDFEVRGLSVWTDLLLDLA